MKTALYNAMSPGHLYLQRYGHPGGADWGMSLRGAGRGKLLVRAVELGAGRELGGTEMGMSAWAKKSGARRTSSSRRMRLRSTHLSQFGQMSPPVRTMLPTSGKKAWPSIE